MSECTANQDCDNQISYKDKHQGRRRIKLIGRNKAVCFFCKVKVEPAK